MTDPARTLGAGVGTELRELVVRICETPAPTFEEAERAELVAGLLSEVGLPAGVDGVGNVVAPVPDGSGPRVLLAAHLDTVFAAGTDVRVRKQGGRWLAPGVGDNSAGLAVLIGFARLLARGGVPGPLPRLTVAATVGEEGRGDLRGIRHLLAERAGEFDQVVAVDGHLGAVVASAVGSKRYQFSLRAQGGHSWGDFPSPSAVHALGDAIHELGSMPVPREPRSSYNVGSVAGGTSVNAIAEYARFDLDLRSVDPAALEELEREALARTRKVARRHGVSLEVELIGDRPAGRSDNAALVRAAREALESVGVEARVVASSTDANAAFALGLPAVAFGVYRGGDAHRLSEWLEPASLEVGFAALARLVGRLAVPAG